MVSGFLVVVPLALTFLVFEFVVTYLDEILRPRFDNTPLDFPGIGLVVILISLYLIGAIVSARLGRKAFDVQHAVLARVPVVKSVYGVARQATDAPFDADGAADQQGRVHRMAQAGLQGPGLCHRLHSRPTTSIRHG